MYQYSSSKQIRLLALIGHYLFLDISGRTEQCTHNLHQADVVG